MTVHDEVTAKRHQTIKIHIFCLLMSAGIGFLMSGFSVSAEGAAPVVHIQTKNSTVSVPVKAICADGSNHLFLPSGTSQDDILYDAGDDSQNYTTMTDENIGSLHFFSDDPVDQGMNYIHGSSDHSARASGSIVLLDDQLNVEYEGTVDAIKGRGNLTWRASSKRPYQIKLAEKVNLIDPSDTSQKARKWILLANYFDPALIRNELAYSLARELGLASTPEGRQVDLYYDGDYRGVYYLCEKVEIGDGRVEINDLDKNPDMLTGGYLLEIDNSYFSSEPHWFNTFAAGVIVIKSPEDLTGEQEAYISSFVTRAMQCILRRGKNERGEFVLFDYFDRDSCVKYFLLMTGLRNADVYYSSTFMYKPEGEDKLYFGPVWDCDYSMGLSGSEPAAEGWNLYRLGKGLMGIPEFRRTAQEVYLEEMKPLLQEFLTAGPSDTRGVTLSSLRNRMTRAGQMNMDAWNLRKIVRRKDQYDAAAAALEDWLHLRYNWLSRTIADEAFLTDPFAEAALPVQEEAVVPQVQTDKDGQNAAGRAKGNRKQPLPGRPKPKVTAKKGKLKVSWKKVKYAAGYQIRWHRYRKGEAVRLKSTRKRSLWIGKLKRRQKYSVRVRAYTVTDGRKRYGKWSKPRTVRVK